MTNPASVEELAKEAKAASQHAITIAIFNSVLTSSPIIDKVASLLLAGIGATLALIVGNLDKTINVIGMNRISLVLYSLIIGGLFGILQKYVAIRVQIYLHISKQAEKLLQPILEQHQKKSDEIWAVASINAVKVDTSIDWTKPVSEIETIVPWYQRQSFKENYKRTLLDPFYGYKQAAHFYNRQVAYSFTELLFSVFALVLVAVGISSLSA